MIKYDGYNSDVTGKLSGAISNSAPDVSNDPVDAFRADKSMDNFLGCGVVSSISRFGVGDEGRGDIGGDMPAAEKDGEGRLCGRELSAGDKRLAGTPLLAVPGTTREGRGAGVGGKSEGFGRLFGAGSVTVMNSSSFGASRTVILVSEWPGPPKSVSVTNSKHS